MVACNSLVVERQRKAVGDYVTRPRDYSAGFYAWRDTNYGYLDVLYYRQYSPRLILCNLYQRPERQGKRIGTMGKCPNACHEDVYDFLTY